MRQFVLVLQINKVNVVSWIYLHCWFNDLEYLYLPLDEWHFVLKWLMMAWERAANITRVQAQFDGVCVVYLPSNMFMLCLSTSHHQAVHKKYKDDIKPFIVQLMHMQSLLKQIKIKKAAPSCFGLQGNHHQQANDTNPLFELASIPRDLVHLA